MAFANIFIGFSSYGQNIEVLTGIWKKDFKFKESLYNFTGFFISATSSDKQKKRCFLIKPA